MPIIAAAFSPYLAWREPIYILAGFAGIIGMCLLLMQPRTGGALVAGAVARDQPPLAQVVRSGPCRCYRDPCRRLWITSPPDVVDALLFVSATPFSAWGVIAMWAGFGAAALGIFRQRLNTAVQGLAAGSCRSLATVTILGSVIHALLIEGTMEVMTKFALCVLVVLVSVGTLTKLRVWEVRR